jgi:hypothetical protein
MIYKLECSSPETVSQYFFPLSKWKEDSSKIGLFILKILFNMAEKYPGVDKGRGKEIRGMDNPL